jgi:outer membrane protein assembly factor BamB
VLWKSAGKLQLVVAGTLRVVGYDLETGREAWTVRGISRTVCMTPVVGEDGNLYVAGWAAGGDADEPIRLPTWDDAVKQDANKNGKLEEAELPKGDIKQRFTQIDRSNDDAIDQAEYDFFRMLFEQGRNLVLAIKPGAVGEATDTHVLWTQSKFVPFCASPLVVNDLVFTVKDGGIVNCLNAKTGKVLKTGRLPKSDDYYASPVTADGKVYFANQLGQVTVVSAEGQWKPLHTADFDEEIYATPALADGRIYLRTDSHLYCFGK